MTELIITSSVLILVVILLRHFLKGKISLRMQYALWALVLVRLLVPVTLFDSPISVMNALQPVADIYEEQTSPRVTTAPSALGDPEDVPPDVTVGVGPAAVTNVYHPVFDWGNLVKWIWYAGIAAFGLCLFLSNLIFGRKLRKTRKQFPADHCPLPVYMAEGLPSPCLFGLFRPAIYITPGVAGDETKLHHVLTHELTHYRHGDHIWSALRAVCLMLHWYNPLVWLAAMLSRRDAELACDEGTIKSIGEENRAEYGRTLIGLTCQKRSAADLLCCATTMTDGKNGIRERITLIAKKPRMAAYTLAGVAVIAAVAVGCTFTGARNNAEIVPLTENEIADFNKTFEPLLPDGEGDAGINPLSHFLRFYYDKPENLNLAEFLRYYPSDEIVTNEAEFGALKAEESWPFGADMTLGNMPVPIHKFSADTVNEVLKKYMGVTLDDLSGVGMDELIYLKEYDAYYNFTSDAAYGSFICASGEKQGDIIRLYGDNVYGDYATLTLKKQGDGFLFVSHQHIGKNTDTKTDNGDVTLYDCDGLSVAIPNEYIEQLMVVTEPEAPEGGLLISVYEKQSYEDSRAASGGEVTAGLLFSIARYTQAQYEQFLMSDGSGQSFFAKDDTYYYGWFIPTDVQFYHSGMESEDIIHSDEWKAWEELNEKCPSIRDDFTERNRLTAYSDDEFWEKEFTYDSEHLYVTYYPYYAYQDTAKAQGFRWQDIAYTLVLSQPATQGDAGIWCVERWYDDDQYGYVYVYFPDADGVPAAEYYAEEQAQRDAGHKVSALDPEQVALEFVRQYFGHTDATFESMTIQGEPS